MNYITLELQRATNPQRLVTEVKDQRGLDVKAQFRQIKTHGIVATQPKTVLFESRTFGGCKGPNF